jgi:hypothetical protein
MCGMSTPVAGRDMPATSEHSVHDVGRLIPTGRTSRKMAGLSYPMRLLCRVLASNERVMKQTRPHTIALSRAAFARDVQTCSRSRRDGVAIVCDEGLIGRLDERRRGFFRMIPHSRLSSRLLPARRWILSDHSPDARERSLVKPGAKFNAKRVRVPQQPGGAHEITRKATMRTGGRASRSETGPCLPSSRFVGDFYPF